MLLVQAKFIVMYALILRFLDLYRKTEKTTVWVTVVFLNLIETQRLL